MARLPKRQEQTAWQIQTAKVCNCKGILMIIFIDSLQKQTFGGRREKVSRFSYHAIYPVTVCPDSYC
jgi:hypothetical protein